MKFTDSEIAKWNGNYDFLKYPTTPYDELVVSGRSHERKIELMGAWKTGSLRMNNNTNQAIYVDEKGNSYEFTNRWKKEAPVGYEVWLFISQNIKDIIDRIPTDIGGDEAPPIVSEFMEKKGFGFIWSVFVLHCIYPNIFPLYDQHVYRTFEYLQSDGTIINSGLAPNSWKEFRQYSDFYFSLLKSSKYSAAEVDRALWAFGKDLKLKNTNASTRAYKSASSLSTRIHDIGNGWCHLLTLGARTKSFWWRLNEDYSVTILRKFDSSNGKDKRSDTIFALEIDKLQQFVDDSIVPLANNVEKLAKGTEKKGLGKFFYDDLNWKDTAKAQVSSQIAALFVYSAIWDYNGKIKGMEFWKLMEDWRQILSSFHSKSLQDE